MEEMKIICRGPIKTYIELHSDSYSSLQDCTKGLGIIITAQWHYIKHLKGILCRISRNDFVNEADSRLSLALKRDDGLSKIHSPPHYCEELTKIWIFLHILRIMPLNNGSLQKHLKLLLDLHSSLLST